MTKKQPHEIFIGAEDGGRIPVVIGKCPGCGVGERSLIIIDFISNPKQSVTHNVVYLKCLCCDQVFQKKIIDVI